MTEFVTFVPTTHALSRGHTCLQQTSRRWYWFSPFLREMNLETLSRYEMPLKFICSLLAVVSCFAVTANAGQFEILGVPVKSVLIMGAVVGVDEKTNEVIYFNCAQPGNRLFLLQVNPDTGRSRQFAARVGVARRAGSMRLSGHLGERLFAEIRSA